MADLTTEFIAYLVTLKAANPTKVDTTTLVSIDLPVVRAGAVAEVDDANTMYERYIV